MTVLIVDNLYIIQYNTHLFVHYYFLDGLNIPQSPDEGSSPFLDLSILSISSSLICNNITNTGSRFL